MVTMEHPNGCVHNVRDDLVDRFKAAGWNIKGGTDCTPVTPAEQKKRTRSKKQ